MTQINVLVRGQSNALLFVDRGGVWALEAKLEQLLGQEVNVLADWGDDSSSIHSATAFMDWDTDGQQASLLKMLAELPAEVRANPTITLWMHNEYDQQNLQLTTEDWLREVQADAELVRTALGQGAETTPYLFVPISYPYGGNFEAIGDGMEALAADPASNAAISWAAQDLRMDGDGWPGSSHMGDADARLLGERLAEELRPIAEAALAKAGGGGADPGAGAAPAPGAGADPGAGGDGDGGGAGDPGAGAGGDGAAEAHHFDAWDGAATIEGFEVGLDRLSATTAYGYVPWVREAERDGVAGTEYRYGWNDDVVWLPGVTGVTVEQLEQPGAAPAPGGADPGAGAGDPGTDGGAGDPGAGGDGDGGGTDSGGTDGGAPGGFNPGAGDGYSVVLADDFSNGYLRENWGDPFHGGVYWNGAWSWDAGDVNVRDGELQVTMTRHDDGWWTGGGFNSFKAGKTITYGTVEFDARVEEAQGTMTAILMWPASDTWPQDGEIDILETPAQDVMHTLHWGGGPDGSEDWYDAVRNQAFDPAQWNHYKMTWLPGDLTVEVNGQVVAHWTGDIVPDGAMGFGAMGNVASANDAWMGGPPDGSTPDTVTVHLDNVVMSQWDGVA